MVQMLRGSGPRVSHPGDRPERHGELTADLVMARRPRPAACVHAASAPGQATVQRHSSWEHKLLGDAKPGELGKIGAWQDLIKQTEREGLLVGEGRFAISPQSATIFGTPKNAVAKVTVPGVRDPIDKGEVMHVLVQEMERLKKWQKNPPTAASADTADAAPMGEDPVYQVVTVRLPAADPKKSLIITYGELNTLADYYGNIELMQTASPKTRFELVQSVRKETYLRLMEIYTKLRDSLTKQEKNLQSVRDARQGFESNKLGKTTFKGAMTPDFISGVKGQADLLAGDKPLIGQGTGAGGGTNAYGASLGRNACHFVPESWHAWAKYHDKARTLAAESYAAFAEAHRKKLAMAGTDYTSRPLDQNEDQTEVLMAQAKCRRLANEALLNNGFGDHYLQDSYASGHMINKTQIMQWYVEFIETNNEWDYFKDKNWRRVQQMAYGQSGLASPGQYDKSKVKGVNPNDPAPNLPRNPQSVEDLGGPWTERFKALGLVVPPSLRTPNTPERKLVEWWQIEAFGGDRQVTGKQLMDGTKIPRRRLEAAVRALITDGVVRAKGESLATRGEHMRTGMGPSMDWSLEFLTAEFYLRENYVPKDAPKFVSAIKQSRRGDDSAYQKMAASVTYGDYMEFMNSGFLQKATNALHDVFCKQGLTVLTGAGQQAFKVFGDDAMFSAESSKGVEESAQTAHMSRDSIRNIVDTGVDGGITTKSIMDRLPSWVQFKVGSLNVEESIETWHNSNKAGYLKDVCMKEVFPGMSWALMQKAVPGLVGSELGKISKDAKVHGSDAF